MQKCSSRAGPRHVREIPHVWGRLIIYRPSRPIFCERFRPRIVLTKTLEDVCSLWRVYAHFGECVSTLRLIFGEIISLSLLTSYFGLFQWRRSVRGSRPTGLPLNVVLRGLHIRARSVTDGCLHTRGHSD